MKDSSQIFLTLCAPLHWKEIIFEDGWMIQSREESCSTQPQLMYQFLFCIHYILYIVFFPHIYVPICLYDVVVALYIEKCLKFWKKWINYVFFNVCRCLQIFSDFFADVVEKLYSGPLPTFCRCQLFQHWDSWPVWLGSQGCSPWVLKTSAPP